MLKIIKNKSTQIKYKKMNNKYLQCHVFAANYIKTVSNRIFNKNFKEFREKELTNEIK